MKNLSLLQRFSIYCFISLLAFGFVLGSVINTSMERNMRTRALDNTADVVSQNVVKHFKAEDLLKPLSGADLESFGEEVEHFSIATGIKKLKFWGPGATVIWDADESLVGKAFPTNSDVARALKGELVLEFSDKYRLRNKYPGEEASAPALELYIPIRYTTGGPVVAVVEAYEDLTPLQEGIKAHTRTIWFTIVMGFSLIFALLSGIVHSASRRITSQRRELEELFIGVVSSMVNALDAKSPWSRGHSDRVAAYTAIIAEEMDLSPKCRESLKYASLLHDIGKIGTYDSLLEKRDHLTPEEFEEVKKHPAKGAFILEGVKQLRDVTPFVMHHHERFDGTGYPTGLKGEDIPLGARILHVSDSFEAIIDERPYRKARSQEQAIEELRAHSGTQFDPRVVEAFIRGLSKHPDLMVSGQGPE